MDYNIQYRCEVSGGVEGLELFDLYVGSPYSEVKATLKLKKGDYIPVHLIDEKVFNQSLYGGCLGRAINSHWIKVISSSSSSSPEVSAPQVEATIVDPVELSERLKKAYMNNQLATPTPDAQQVRRVAIGDGLFVYETVAEVGLQPSTAPYTPPPSPAPVVEPVVNPVEEAKEEIPELVSFVDSIKTYADFCKLQHGKKLSVISKTTNKELLNNIIYNNAVGSQLNSNASKRLIKIGG